MGTISPDPWIEKFLDPRERYEPYEPYELKNPHSKLKIVLVQLVFVRSLRLSFY
jgi:hypothetical protein